MFLNAPRNKTYYTSKHYFSVYLGLQSKRRWLKFKFFLLISFYFFNMLMLKINFKNKKYFLNVFLNKKYFKK